MYGLDVNYRKDIPRLTKLLDKLPFYKTTAPSTINVFAEGAYLKPGHAPQIGKGSIKVIINIDDFDGTQSGYDLRFPPIQLGIGICTIQCNRQNREYHYFSRSCIQMIISIMEKTGQKLPGTRLSQHYNSIKDLIILLQRHVLN